jgi:hypothetical protein
MPQQICGKFMTGRQQIFASFCILMTKICIFLFFHISASKLGELLIKTSASETKNQIESKRTLIQMSLYGHLRRAVTSRRRQRPRSIRAKKQTFSNFSSCPLRLCGEIAYCFC